MAREHRFVQLHSLSPVQRRRRCSSFNFTGQVVAAVGGRALAPSCVNHGHRCGMYVILLTNSVGWHIMPCGTLHLTLLSFCSSEVRPLAARDSVMIPDNGVEETLGSDNCVFSCIRQLYTICGGHGSVVHAEVRCRIQSQVLSNLLNSCRCHMISLS